MIIRLIPDSLERRQWMNIFKIWEEKALILEHSNLPRLSFKCKGEIKTYVLKTAEIWYKECLKTFFGKVLQ